MNGDLDKHSDIDQGNYTLPLIHALKYQKENGSTELQSILQARKENNGMTASMKRLFFRRLREIGSLEYTQTIIQELQGRIMEELEMIEDKVGEKNWILRLLLHQIKIWEAAGRKAGWHLVCKTYDMLIFSQTRLCPGRVLETDT